ncbi:TonB family protein [Spirosoma luteum]|uniref:TonB family protein n=1 Tax=Spirosoma luteum TaxID=431553 RepID=UPI000379423B|nr:TonB family protein [Spirosoma luteum]
MFIRLLCLLLLLVCPPALAQQPAYKDFDVDSVAVPHGGIAFLNTYLQTNLRKPIAAEAEGLGGRVIISSVIEPDGSVSDVSVLKSLRPDMDQEAIRVFSLFRAWKPALKGGKAVRQQMNIPITFAKNEPFVYQNESKILYFDAKLEPLADSARAQYKQITPINVTRLPTGDIVLYERKDKSWKLINRFPITRKLKSYKTATGKWVHLTGHQNANVQWESILVATDEDGNRVRQAYYQNGKRVGEELYYHPNGVVSRKAETFDTKEAVTSWYPNGQIRKISTGVSERKIGTDIPEQVIAFWDSTGRQLVDKGNGRAILVERRESYADTSVYTTFTEEGSYKDGLKHGDWIGRYADNSYSYEEKYVDGVLKEGQTRTGQADVVRYTVLEQQPEFPGGMAGLGNFLSENLSYPVSAQKEGIQGKVFVSFVVCTDGSLCDYEVMKGVHPDVDKEALRVVRKMSGRWKPGVQRGKKVRVKYNLPINFSLY